ncbi:MAG: hypothetical protein H8E40_16125, partial [Chloroflexi bacterium]|nr:hypothetical protein [Chloroflexota bacterium]
MRNLIITILIACLAIIWLTPPVRAQMVTIDEALTVANNWIDLIIQNKGDWGGSRVARVGEKKELKSGEGILGYFCSVETQGFIVTSRDKTLAPVKTASPKCNLYPECDEGRTDLIKGG